MLRKRFIAAALVLALALAACGAPEKSSGLLTENEIEKMESLYLTGSDGALEKLGIAEDDIDTGRESYETLSNVGIYPLKETRSIEGTEFRQFVNISILSEPYGFYGVRFTANFVEHEDAAAAVRAIYEKATELYGDPTTYEGHSNILSGQLDDPQAGFEVWRAGELTELQMSLFRAEDAANFDPSWEYRYSLDILYGIPKVVDGKLLTGDEMLEMVKSVQEKQ